MRLRTDLLKGFGYWEGNMFSPWHFAERVFFDYSDADIEFREVSTLETTSSISSKYI